MELKQEQIEKFKSLHQSGELDGLTEGQIRNIAGGVVRLFLALKSIKDRLDKAKNDDSRIDNND
ncbi:MAG: hypothetical protein A2669_01930 [Candidatus Yanofskybacteria bacterium RIFCSPHIGHO2_01_FULL_48_25b]|uniref:Uncharacterized protein n=1 Tax=Candidatus Yanofskybacteria bacterium RIFCSPHIGHO2_01_FULL_48_25b TaxID=1802672 RepID=A0A1F8F5D4_9BACT|nr:MAG: hypothetical protein A2669_01930 [Candidatus Yanofskybacteria bacterium RIFCSPHIGHO2_01_FULL_48_25b]